MTTPTIVTLSSLPIPKPHLRPKPLALALHPTTHAHPRRVSLRHTVEHLPLNQALTLSRNPSRLRPPLRSSLPAPDSPHPTRTHPPPFPSIPIPSLDLSGVTPLTVCKWAAAASLAVVATRKAVSLLLNPFFWMYFSWTWMYWPWYVAAFAAGYGLYSLRKHLAGESAVFEQLAVVTSAITWLTAVPAGHFNGYLEGWPVAFFFVYHYFFFFESSVRKRMYGDLQSRPHDPKWDVKAPRAVSAMFVALVFVGHWLAAFEGPEPHLVPGGWTNLGMWGLIMVVLFARYHSVLYLAKYSERVVEPTAVVQFGPYRWVRHPIYASTIFLFATYCVALRATLNLVFLVGACLVYYGQKAELEERLMMDEFGEKYEKYASKVKYKLIPFLY